MLAPPPAKTSVTRAMRPGASTWRTTKVVRRPVSLTCMPSMRLTRTWPPPTELPSMLTWAPSVPASSMSAVLGCSPSASPSAKLTATPRSRAIASESRRRTSSVAMPSTPATMARSVPWPRPVLAKLP